MPKTVIHTFNARSNALLQIVRADGSFSPQAMRDEIQGMLTRTVAILASKAIQYSDLNRFQSDRVASYRLRRPR